ncbi:hypothetical protein PQ455_13400 [Sphingomonas naphthae]|uniref:Uncharacterized protein n=1 Tax=Sphingomonas naphthae TaxID=1813468 RepID=A0ABY7TI95_9SPHN|nr:hypothetical protein [Sphingomonas naphthae]WCT72623.1 hypothetical protein PQ455_13400 [Sphingomonas naphthae]
MNKEEIGDRKVAVKLRPGRKPAEPGTISDAVRLTRERIAEAADRLVDAGVWPSPAKVSEYDPTLSRGNVAHHPGALLEARRRWVRLNGSNPHWQDPESIDERKAAGSRAKSVDPGEAACTCASCADPASEPLELERRRVRRLESELRERDEAIAQLKQIVANAKEINSRLMKGLRPPMQPHPGDGGPPPV